MYISNWGRFERRIGGSRASGGVRSRDMSKIAREVNELLTPTKIWRCDEWRALGKSPVKVVWK